ncbi:hypothetical protein EAD89_16455 [Micromonospora sp. BL4]|uniref:DUF6308 family protein n=1 Tax=Micromonospora sp. BL4 TaxID=2478710 RepID=UPI000EF5C39C|nr:DUF6308 family protein [Micromonospora sp. BL4]RLP88629.1 hypothetical protein EAD89_16455 [Micromonospora sp. BL4]
MPNHTMATIGLLRGCADQHLSAYIDPSAGFAFGSYDRWYTTPDRLTPLDCLAGNLLSLRLGHAEVIPLFQPGPSAATRLREAMQQVLDQTSPEPTPSDPQFLTLRSIEDDAFRLLRDANTLTSEVPEWTAVAVCKVLHRLRPHFVPLYDSVLRNFYGTSRERPADFFAALLEDLKANHEWLSEFSEGVRTPDGRQLSVLRLADIVIWHHSRFGCPEG